MARVLTITANPLLNFLAQEPLQAGRVNRVAHLTPAAEGKGVNVARILAAHGHQVCAAVCAGGATGTLLAEVLATEDLPCDRYAPAATLRCGFMTTAPAGGKPTTLLANGFAVSGVEARAWCERLASLLPGQDLVIASGSVPDPNLDDCYRFLATACAEREIPFWLDAYGPAVDRALQGPYPPQLTKPNKEEYASSQHWRRSGWVHRSDGGAGVDIIATVGRWRVTPPPVTERNPIGSGDSYIAALAHATLEDWPLERRFAYAAAAGAANASRDDVARVRPPDIAALVPGARVEHSEEEA